jgi:hypothetical protein
LAVARDDAGWTSVFGLLSALREQGGRWADVDRDDLDRMIATATKRRHEIRGDEIRALYGHSVPGRLAKQPATPPSVLFHGTAPSASRLILRVGLKPMARQYVHLSAEVCGSTAATSSCGLPTPSRQSSCQPTTADATRIRRLDIAATRSASTTGRGFEHVASDSRYLHLADAGEAARRVRHNDVVSSEDLALRGDRSRPTSPANSTRSFAWWSAPGDVRPCSTSATGSSVGTRCGSRRRGRCGHAGSFSVPEVGRGRCGSCTATPTSTASAPTRTLTSRVSATWLVAPDRRARQRWKATEWWAREGVAGRNGPPSCPRDRGRHRPPHASSGSRAPDTPAGLRMTAAVSAEAPPSAPSSRRHGRTCRRRR